MTTLLSTELDTRPLVPRVRQAALVFFFLSGCAALVYEVLWVRLLGFVFGNTTYAVSTVLAAYMAGLGFGSFWGGRAAARWKNPIWLYGCLEISIGVYAAGTLLFIRLIQYIYVGAAYAWLSGSPWLTVLRVALAFMMVFLPAFAMGATLPVLVQFWTRFFKSVGAGTALLYGVNTAGAVAGTFLAGFYLLPILGIRSTLIITVTLNVGIGLLACSMARKIERAGGALLKEPETQALYGASKEKSPALLHGLAWGLAGSGVTAMIYEVAWTRALSTVLGSSTYAFTIMLTTFLFGIALGSAIYQQRLSRRFASVAEWGWLQLVIAGSALLVLPFFERVDFWMLRLVALTLDAPGLLEFFRFLVCAFFMIVPAVCFGALFPVTVALQTQNPAMVSKQVGRLYLMNTAGNLLGSLGAGFLLIPAVGIHHAIWIAILLNALIGAAALLTRALLPLHRVVAAVALGMLALGLWFNRTGWDASRMTAGLHIRPGEYLDKKGRDIMNAVYMRDVLFYREGVHNIVSVDQIGDQRHLRVNGKVDASTGSDMITQLLLGHLPHLLHPNPKRSLVIGYGSGATVAAALAHPMEQVDAVEIEKAVLEAAPLFNRINRKSYQHPKVRIFYNDGRNQLLLQNSRYDVIISEPSNPWMAGVATLFSVDFYQLAKNKLNSDGIFCQWLQAYEISPRDFQMVVASVQSVFPYVMIWRASAGDMLLIASSVPIEFRYEEMNQRLQQFPEILSDLRQHEIRSAAGILSYYLLGHQDVAQLAAGGTLNTDDQLILEFSAPKFLYEKTLPVIHEILMGYRRAKLPTIRTTNPKFVQDPAILSDVGYGYLGQQSIEEAIVFFNNALQFDATHVEARLGLAEIDLRRKQNLPQVLATLQEIATAAPQHARAQALYGEILLMVGRPQEALSAYQAALKAEPDQWEYYRDQAKVLEQLQIYQAAMASLERAIALAPETLTLLLEKVRLLRILQQYQQAWQILVILRAQYPAYLPIYKEALYLSGAQGNWQSAVGAYEMLVQRNPYSIDAWLDLLMLYAKQNEDHKGAGVLKRIKKLNPMAYQAIQVAHPAGQDAQKI